VSSNARDVNKAFAAYVQSNESERSQREQEFIKALRNYGNAIVWLTMSRQSPEIVDAGIDAALQHYEAFRGKAKFSTWYWQIVRRLCWGELRKKARSKEVLFSDLDPQQVEQFAAPAADGDARLTLEWLMKRLPAEAAAFLRMKLEGLTHAEMGKRLGMSASAVGARWIRIRDRLRKDTGMTDSGKKGT